MHLSKISVFILIASSSLLAANDYYDLETFLDEVPNESLRIYHDILHHPEARNLDPDAITQALEGWLGEDGLGNPAIIEEPTKLHDLQELLIVTRMNPSPQHIPALKSIFEAEYPPVYQRIDTIAETGVSLGAYLQDNPDYLLNHARNVEKPEDILPAAGAVIGLAHYLEDYELLGSLKGNDKEQMITHEVPDYTSVKAKYTGAFASLQSSLRHMFSAELEPHLAEYLPREPFGITYATSSVLFGTNETATTIYLRIAFFMRNFPVGTEEGNQRLRRMADQHFERLREEGRESKIPKSLYGLYRLGVPLSAEEQQIVMQSIPMPEYGTWDFERREPLIVDRWLWTGEQFQLVKEELEISDAQVDHNESSPPVDSEPKVGALEPSGEATEQSSDWWLWLIGALIAIGGLGVMLRRKN